MSGRVPPRPLYNLSTGYIIHQVKVVWLELSILCMAATPHDAESLVCTQNKLIAKKSVFENLKEERNRNKG